MLSDGLLTGHATFPTSPETSSASSDSQVPKDSGTPAEETMDLLQTCISQLIPFISKSDREREEHRIQPVSLANDTSLSSAESLDPHWLQANLRTCLNLPTRGNGIDGFQKTLKDILRYSVNPSAPGFLDKLYSAPVPPGIAAELILAVLNTNLHVYQVSPVLTTIEKHVTKQLAALFGFDGPRAGGVSVQGGSASNSTSIVVARNTLYPETKTYGNSVKGRSLVMFTSAHGHYSVEKAAQSLGFGSTAVISVPTDMSGRMKSDELERLIMESRSRGKTPFYINATAGTTVLGSFDPFENIAKIARKYRCWLHIDGAWGGSFVFSIKDNFRTKLTGMSLADSIAINPHKMMGIPLTCSFLLVRDLRLLHQAMTLKAGYLFHEFEDEDEPKNDKAVNDETEEPREVSIIEAAETCQSFFNQRDEDGAWTEPNDLADMTLQCGRRGDSLKLLMAWQYYGTAGYAKKIEDAYDIALYLNNLVDNHKDLTLVLGQGSKPSCLQVCFYYTPNTKFVFGLSQERGIIAIPTAQSLRDTGKQNTRVTSRISRALIPRGFMVDFAPALEGQEDKGHFLRVVINISTIKETAERLVNEVVVAGELVTKQLQERFTKTH